MIKINSKYKVLGARNIRYFIVTGGRGSGKSFSVNTAITALVTGEEGHKVLFTRYTLTAAEKSIIPEFIEKIEITGTQNEFDVKAKSITNKVTGSEILFEGIKTSSGNQTAKLKSLQGVTTWVLDEAEELEDEKVFDDIDLSIRQKGIQNRVIIVMNPSTKEHFIYKRFFEQMGVNEGFNGVVGNVAYIHTTFIDNIKNLSQSFIDNVELMKIRRPEKYKHQIMGAWLSRAEGVIFENWKVGKFEEIGQKIFGQDYGFSIDPTTLIEINVDKNNMNIYVRECYYKKGMATSEIADLNKKYAGKNLIIGDSAEPRLISELQKLGNNIRGAEKGQGSITAGISMLQDYNIIVDPNSINLIKEFNNYAWSDKKSSTPIDNWNHCFVGETLIETINGSKRIDTIKVGDLVMTSNGYKPVSKFFNNGCDEVLHMSISFRNLVVDIKATANHKIKTTKGWKQLKDLKTGDVLYTLKKSNLKDNFSTETCIINTQAKDTSPKEQDFCTETYGCTTMEKFPRDITSTTLMETDITTISKTSTAYVEENTSVCTFKKDCHATKKCKKQETEWIMQESMHQNGMVQKRVRRGIGNIMKKRWGLERKQSLNVNNVTANTKPLLGNRIGSAQTNVSQSGEEIQALTMLRENASSVRLNSKPTNTAQQKCVVENAVVCIDVKNVSKENVFDIEVQDMHEYFANGVLVHNCIDPIRYGLTYTHKRVFQFSII